MQTHSLPLGYKPTQRLDSILPKAYEYFTINNSDISMKNLKQWGLKLLSQKEIQEHNRLENMYGDYNRLINKHPNTFYDIDKKDILLEDTNDLVTMSIKNEKGREIQAKAVLKEVEKAEVKGLYNVAYNGKNATRVFKDLKAVEEAIFLTQGNRYKGAKHIRIKHLSDKTKKDMLLL